MVNCLPATTLYARFGSAGAPEWWALVLPLLESWRRGGMGVGDDDIASETTAMSCFIWLVLNWIPDLAGDEHRK